MIRTIAPQTGQATWTYRVLRMFRCASGREALAGG
jgi:hypothetical protein